MIGDIQLCDVNYFEQNFKVQIELFSIKNRK